MNKTLNINLSGFIFHIDEEAYIKLEAYLKVLKNQFSRTEGGLEIIKDIEMRLAELFKERISEQKEVISLADVEEVIAIMGNPEDYLDADEDFQNTESKNYYNINSGSKKRIFRDPDDRIIGGVAAGLAAYFNIEALWVRILFILLTISGFGIFFYIIMWVIIPQASNTAEKLQMRGASVNISNIEKAVRDEAQSMENSFKKYSSNANTNKAGSQIGNVIRDISDLLIRVIKALLKIIITIIGFVFLIIACIIIFGLIVGLFTGGYQLAGGGHYGLQEAIAFGQLLTLNDTHLMLLSIGLGLLILAPLTLITHIGLRIIFKLGRMNSPTRNSLIISTFIGFLMVFFSALRIGLDFDHRASYSNTTTLNSSHEHLYLKVNEDAIYKHFKDEMFAPEWLQKNDSNLFTNVYLDIKKSKDSIPHILIEKKSQGRTRREARANATMAHYNFNVQDSLLNFDLYYTLKKDALFRGQEIQIILYIPEGTAVYLDENMVDIIYDIKNIHNTWDFDMVGHTWLMTNEGLLCTDCPNNTIPKSKKEYQWPSDTNKPSRMDLEIDEDGMRMQISSLNSSFNTQINQKLQSRII